MIDKILTFSSILVLILIYHSCQSIEGSGEGNFGITNTSEYLLDDERIDKSFAFRGTALRISEIDSYVPEQVHLSLGLNCQEIYITWSTLKRVSKPRIDYLVLKDGLPFLWVNKEVNITEWISGNDNDNNKHPSDKQRNHYTYRAKLKNLLPNTDYLYRVVSEYVYDDSKAVVVNEVYSVYYTFSSRDLSQTNMKLRVALYGDLGLVNGQSIPRLIEKVDNKEYHLIIHNGDFAYDLDRFSGKHGDEFMRKIEPISARLPYQTSVGNHEIKEKFLHYDQRFTMINSGSGPKSPEYGNQNNFYYSFNAGPVHFIAISTEFYYFYDYIGFEPLYEQYNWLIKDLEFATKKSQRTQTPWIIVYGHRPMYCSSDDNDDCTKDGDILRNGIPFIKSYGLEKLFYTYGVDVLFWSHEHQYERFLPIYNNEIMNGTDDANDPYFNPRGPVHIISGSAGCEERIDDFKGKVAIGSVVRISDYGFTELTASKEKLIFEQVSDDNDGKVVDKFTITKTVQQNFPISINK